jgi:hypothetical protein
MAQGYVVVIQLGDTRAVPGLIDHLAGAGLDVLSEAEGLDGNLRWKAAALLLALGRGTELPATDYRVTEPLRMGSLVPVLLSRTASVDPASGLRPVDLSTWRGGPDPELDRLVAMLRALVAGGRPRGGGPGLTDGTSVDTAESALAQLRGLTSQVGQIGELLIGGDQRRIELGQALDEVGATYKAVSDAVSQYAAAVGGGAIIDRARFHQLARTDLLDRIHNGRGSCTRIATLYRRAGGLRAAIATGSPQLLPEADEAFGTLSGSDYTLFQQMEDLGAALTAESRAVENLLITGQDAAAARRAADGWMRVAPLEIALGQARRELQAVQEALGYVEHVPATGGITVTISKVNIAGNVVNSNVVAARSIESSSLIASAAPVPQELKTALADLQRAVAELTAHLPDDEADLAARDLEDLTNEAVSPTPRPAFWRRAVDGLLAAAKTAADVGAPVVDLVAKVVALLA